MAQMMRSLQSWNSDSFKQTLKEELEGFRSDVLPLQQVVGHGNRVYDHDLGITVMKVTDDEASIYAKFGVFFAEVVTCVSCGEGDPIDEAYGEMQVTIDKQTAEATFTVLQH